MPKLLLKGGKIVNADQSFYGDVLCDDGKIVQIGSAIEASEGVEVVDVSGKLLVPGGIDPHTHMSLPFMGTVSIDDFYSGGRAALAGGTTTIIDFVIPSPGQSLIDAYQSWRKWSEECVCDYAFHIAITWWSDQVREEMGILAREHGTTSFKHFMAYKGALMLNDESLYQSFSRAKELGCLSTVHAENGELVFQAQRSLIKKGITGPEGHPWSRPVEVEEEATHRASIIANTVNTPVYIVHVSCKPAMEVIQRARAKGWRIYGEALAGHLTIDDSVYFKSTWQDSAAYVMSPPFRSKEHQEALWQGLQSGTLQTTATDHCTFCSEQKAMGKEDFTKIPNGAGGVEDRMSVLFAKGVLSGKLTENEYVAVTSTNTAKIFNLYPRKGVIAVGSDADIAVIDPKVHRVISKTTHFQKVDHNVWEGWDINGVTVMTISQGEVVWRAFIEDDGVTANWPKGTLTTSRGRGKYLSRPAYGASFSGLDLRQQNYSPITRP